MIDLQEKLHSTLGRNRKKFAIGIYPLEKIRLPIIYKALPPKQIKFVPLESDREMDALQILAKHPTGKEYAHLLEGKDKFPVFMDANSKILSMPPIINSHETGKVSEETKEVFVECSGFDQGILNKTLNIVITTLADMGGTVYEMELSSSKKIITPDLSPEKMSISADKANKLLGTKFKDSDVPKLLAKMGLGFQGKTAIIPAWRTDILHEVDIIEEIAIAYGYDSLEPEVPHVSTVAEENQEDKFKNKIKEILVGLGLLEISSFHMIKQNESEIMSLKEPIEVENSKTEYKILRPNLLIPALRILTENKDHEYPQDFFEVGTVFDRDEKEETGIKENSNLLILQAPGNFTKMKQTLTYLFSSLGLQFSLKENSHPQLIDGRSASILLEGKEVGYLGELHPSTLKAWTIKMPAAVMEISLEEVFDKLTK